LKRLGANSGVEEVKQMGFCNEIDWDLLLKKKIKGAPVKIDLKAENFDPEYT
jgi:hypothetical protein